MIQDPEKDRGDRDGGEASQGAAELGPVAGTCAPAPEAPQIPTGTTTLVAEPPPRAGVSRPESGTASYRAVLRCRTRRAAD